MQNDHTMARTKAMRIKANASHRFHAGTGDAADGIGGAAVPRRA